MGEREIDALARIVWDYHHMNQPLEKADVILVQGSHDLRVAERGAELFLDGWAPLLILSGGLGNLTRGIWEEPEADAFARTALRMGVPRSAMRIENRSTNTGENVRFTRRLLESEGLDPDRFLPERSEGRPRLAYFPFGAGGRSCVGEDFAMLEATLALAMTVRRFDVRPVRGHPVEPDPILTLRPRYGIQVRMRAR